MIPTGVATVVGIMLISLALWSSKKFNTQKKITVTIDPFAKDFYLTLSGYSEHEKDELKKLVMFEMQGIANKITEYENKKRQTEKESKETRDHNIGTH